MYILMLCFNLKMESGAITQRVPGTVEPWILCCQSANSTRLHLSYKTEERQTVTPL